MRWEAPKTKAKVFLPKYVGLRVETKNAVGEVLTEDGVITQTTKAFSYMKGWRGKRFANFCKSHGIKYSVLISDDPSRQVYPKADPMLNVKQDRDY
jgi:hypothetical protein